MGDTEAELRDRLAVVGLGDRADALIELALPSIGLRSEAEPVGEVLGRPPAAVWGLGTGVTAIAGGGGNLALRDDGTVVGWGYNDRGGLGDGSTKFRRSPVAVCDITDVTAIATGLGHSVALSSSGAVLAWGLNRNGQLGDGTYTDSHTPVPVSGLDRDVIAVAAGEDVSLALTSAGSVVGWGHSPAVEMAREPTAIRVPGLERGIVAVAAGRYHRLALIADGTVLAWGFARSSALGIQPAEPGGAPYVYGPARVEGLPAGIRAIAAGMEHCLALTAEGSVFAWGENSSGALGDGTNQRRYRPVAVRGLDGGVRAIAAGWGCSYALTDDGAVVSWGWNFDGKLGDGSPTKGPNGMTPHRVAPGPVPALRKGVAAISDCVALMSDGSVRAWGGEYEPDEHGADARLGLAATKLGGRPDLRARSRWPTRAGRPLAFVAQVDLAELAPLDRSARLPPAGLLSFFYSDPAGPLEPELGEVILSEPGSPLSRREFPDGLPDHARYRAVALQPELQLTLPPQPPPLLSDQEQDAYKYDLDELTPGPRHRMLGHPGLVQHDPREADTLLLQVDSDDAASMMWGDVGRLYYVIGLEDLRAQRFSASRCVLQSH